MAEGYKSGLIAALRGGGNYNSVQAGAGPQALNLSWNNSGGVPLAVRRRPGGGALNPQRLTTQAIAPKDRQTFLAQQFARQADRWTPQSGYVNPVAALIDANKDRVEYVETANDVLNREQLMPSAPSAVASILPDADVDMKGPTYGSGGMVMAKGTPGDMEPVVADRSVPEPVMEEPDVQAFIENEIASSMPTVAAPPAEITEEADPEVAITYQEVPDVEPSVRETLAQLIDAPPAELTQEQDPEVAISVEQVPDVEPSTLRETLSALVPAATPAEMEAEPETTVTVEEIPQEEVYVDARRSGGGYGIDTGLSREMMMLAALADMVGAVDPQGTITIEELQELV
jgi:hypothetical protein